MFTSAFPLGEASRATIRVLPSDGGTAGSETSKMQFVNMSLPFGTVGVCVATLTGTNIIGPPR